MTLCTIFSVVRATLDKIEGGTVQTNKVTLNKGHWTSLDWLRDHLSLSNLEAKRSVLECTQTVHCRACQRRRQLRRSHKRTAPPSLWQKKPPAASPPSPSIAITGQAGICYSSQPSPVSRHLNARHIVARFSSESFSTSLCPLVRRTLLDVFHPSSYFLTLAPFVCIHWEASGAQVLVRFGSGG